VLRLVFPEPFADLGKQIAALHFSNFHLLYHLDLCNVSVFQWNNIPESPNRADPGIKILSLFKVHKNGKNCFT